MRIAIDEEMCTGHGRCYVLVPELFDSDDVGHGVVIQPDVPPDLEERARVAAASCPERAIHLAT